MSDELQAAQPLPRVLVVTIEALTDMAPDEWAQYLLHLLRNEEIVSLIVRLVEGVGV